MCEIKIIYLFKLHITPKQLQLKNIAFERIQKCLSIKSAIKYNLRHMFVCFIIYFFIIKVCIQKRFTRSIPAEI